MIFSKKQAIPPAYMHIVGNNVVTAQDLEFSTGYSEGYDHFNACHAHSLLSDEQVAKIFLDIMTNVKYSARHQAGYIAGWITALSGAKALYSIATSEEV